MKKVLKNKGSVTVEATIALPLFIFVILTIASIIRIAYVQSVVYHAVTESANEISKYSYYYSVSGAKDGTSKAVREVAPLNETLAIILDSYKILNASKEEIQSNAISMLGLGKADIQSILENGPREDLHKVFSGIKDSDLALIIQCYMANGAFEDLRGEYADVVMKTIVRKHFAVTKYDASGKEIKHIDADKRLKGLALENGISGLDFTKTKMFEDKETIDIIVSYKVKPPIDIFGVIPDIPITQRIITKGWLDGKEHEDSEYEEETETEGEKAGAS